MSAFDRVIGYKETKQELMRYADILKNPEKYSKLGVTVPSGIMLIGEPGLGKTLMAKCFAEEAGCPTYIIRKNVPDGEFINLIRETYATASKNSPAVIILDDLDKYANEDQSRCNAEEYVTVQACIDEHKGSGVFSLVTVNDEFCLPDSLKRSGRFDETIRVDIPEGKEAREIIAYYLNQKDVIGNIDMEEICRIMEDLSCAEIENVVNKAGVYAGFSGKKKIDQKDLIAAFMRTQYQSKDNTLSFNENGIDTIAVHEAGHAVVYETLDPGSVSIVSICTPGSDNKGVVKLHAPEKYPYSKMLHDHRIIGMLGGKAASEVVSGEIDLGCGSDLREAYDMVEEYIDSKCAYGFYAFERCTSSAQLLDRKEQRVAAEIERFYLEAKKIIIENRPFYDAIVEALLDHKTVTYREMQELRERYVQENAQMI